MKNLIFLSLLLLLIPVLAFAQSQKITINVDEKSFQPGQIAELKGSVDPSLAGTPVAVEVKDGQGQVIIVRTVQPDANGNFVLKFKVPVNAKGSEFQVSSSVESQGETITESQKIEIPESAPVSETAKPVCGTGTVLENGVCVPAKTTKIEEKKSGCLVATATYGSELAPQVQLLREVRDNVLSTNSGMSFMTGFNSVYYTFSPTIADWERQSPLFKELVRITITPMISTLSTLNYVDVDSEQEVFGYGIGIILLNTGIYFGIPIFVIVKVRQKFKIIK